MRRKRNVGGEACGTGRDFGSGKRLRRLRFEQENTPRFGAVMHLETSVSSRRFSKNVI